MTSWLRRAVGMVAVATAVIGAPAAAHASFVTGGVGSVTVSSGSLGAPADVRTTKHCTVADLSVTVDWTPGAGPRPSGYTVTLTPLLGSPLVTTVTGGSTGEVSVPIGLSLQYAVSVTAGYRAWTSPAAAGPVPILCTALAGAQS